MTASPTDAVTPLTCGALDHGTLASLLGRYRLRLRVVTDGAAIPGSYWGPPEAGLTGSTVWVREDTPVHSLLHESAHVACMDRGRRAALERDAGGDDLEEAAVCYLQLMLADELPGVGRPRLMIDMDAWGYSFRLGTTAAWLATDADDARGWLIREGLLDETGRITWRRRDDRVR